MIDKKFLTADFRELPYWWDKAPLTPESVNELPASADVAVVGSGFSGLMAALTLARDGKSVVVIDSENCGYGASRRNAGFLGRTLKRSHEWLCKEKGESYGDAVYAELNSALHLVEDIVDAEGITCYRNTCGRFIGANSIAHYRLLEKELARNRAVLGSDFEMIPRSEQHREIQTDVYFGGAVIPDLGSIHPGLYHDGLVKRAREAGVVFISQTKVKSIGKSGEFRQIETTRGSIKARDVVVGTNGYSAELMPWLQRRVIPFTGYMIATEELPAGKVEELLPNRRTYLETVMNINFIRPAPDTNRILFGGMTGRNVPGPMDLAGDLRKLLLTILPGLGDDLALSHAWSGKCGGTFDFMPHIGVHDGIHYAVGYNFAGVPMGTYFGVKMAQKILGMKEGYSVFETQAFPTMPLYRGNPWFVPLTMKMFDVKDRWISFAG